MSIFNKMLRIAGRGPDGTAKAIKTDASGNIQMTIIGSLAKLSTDPFPAGEEGQKLEVFYPDKADNKYFRFVSGDWREY